MLETGCKHVALLLLLPLDCEGAEARRASRSGTQVIIKNKQLIDTEFHTFFSMANFFVFCFSSIIFEEVLLAKQLRLTSAKQLN
jgi:hypothetical protein